MRSSVSFVSFDAYMHVQTNVRAVSYSEVSQCLERHIAKYFKMKIRAPLSAYFTPSNHLISYVECIC